MAGREAAFRRGQAQAVAGRGGIGKDALQENDSAPETRATAAVQTPVERPVEGPPATMNTPVRDGKFEFVVKTVQPGLTEVGDNPFLNQKAQGQFVIVTLSVQNIGDRAQGFSPSNQKLFDTEGRSFESDSTAQIALGTGDIPVWDNIDPGNTADVKLVYDMRWVRCRRASNCTTRCSQAASQWISGRSIRPDVSKRQRP